VAVLIGVCLLFNSSVLAGTAESILVKENEKGIEISVPVSKLTLSLPKANFQRSLPVNRKGGTANPRYFKFSDMTTGISVSGWFEHASRFVGMQEPDPASFKGIPLIYENITFGKVADWDSVSYDVVFQDKVFPNIKASVVREGTWIEIHISGNQHDALRDILTSLRVEVKP
jgi:hypothetical protein